MRQSWRQHQRRTIAKRVARATLARLDANGALNARDRTEILALAIGELQEHHRTCVALLDRGAEIERARRARITAEQWPQIVEGLR
jgi:hypothetical protein